MKKILIPFMLLIIVIGGCNPMDKSDDNGKPVNGDTKANNQEGMNEYEKDNFVPVQEYTGEGYTLEGARKETGEIANEHREEVEKAVDDFFLDEYKTEVNVHNFVNAKDGVSVFVESIGEPHFYTYVVVPADIKNKEVLTDQVWSQGRQVERAIGAGLYAMAFEEEFHNLNNYLEGIVEENPVVGRTKESIENVGGEGFSTPYYRFNHGGDVIEKLSEKFIEDPEMTKEELKSFFQENELEPKNAIFVIELFMAEDVEPDTNLFEKITTDIEEMNNLPRGIYTVMIHDNYIDKETFRGLKENTERLIHPNEILKE